MIGWTRQRRRHIRLMDAATHLVVTAERSRVKEPKDVRPADVLALVFGEYRMRATDMEAAETLAAALVAHGHRADHLTMDGASYEAGPSVIVAARVEPGSGGTQ